MSAHLYVAECSSQDYRVSLGGNKKESKSLRKEKCKEFFFLKKKKIFELRENW